MLNAQISQTNDAAEKLRLKDMVDYMRKVEMAVVISEDADEEAKFAAEGLSIKPHRERMNKVDENGFDKYTFVDVPGKYAKGYKNLTMNFLLVVLNLIKKL